MITNESKIAYHRVHDDSDSEAHWHIHVSHGPRLSPLTDRNNDITADFLLEDQEIQRSPTETYTLYKVFQSLFTVTQISDAY